ncbi:hypothetical protein GCM10010346_65050 [Streptomyces chryseus]|uniref:Uncharacterized protein n=1 Tax=Streptomyces chryseus TaxID=68186 RepID=A0ABQ3EF56_9ACTN|nr:hypothetical protein GCM10010346_65050 [Streptomyces chryseus]
MSRVPPGAAPTTEPSAGTVLGAAAASPAAYNADTAQETATALIRLLMEQLGLAPGGIAPRDRAGTPGTGARGPAGGPGRPSRGRAEHTGGKWSPGKGTRVKQEREEWR